MNGFIFPKASSFPVLASLCLSSGFFAGFNFHGLNQDFMNPLEFFNKKEIEFTKISWLKNTVKSGQITFASVDYPEPEILRQEIKLAEYHFEQIRREKTNLEFNNQQLNAFKKLEKAVQSLSDYDLFDDYRKTSESLRNQFITAVTRQNPDSIQFAKFQDGSDKNEHSEKSIVPFFRSNSSQTHKFAKKDLLASGILQKTPGVKSRNIQIAAANKPNQQPFFIEKVKTEKSSAANQAVKGHQYLDHHTVPNLLSLNSKTFKEGGECKIAPKLHLKAPGQKYSTLNNQICPSQKTWISKGWRNEGWARFEVEGYLPFITYYPQINHSFTGLLDQNSIALLSLKSGIRSYNGYGIIYGILPDMAQVEFLGRAEEVQYFEMDGDRYFYFLNAEPGAGVLEVKYSEKNIQTTLFTPVLSNTVTYLDLKDSIQMDLPIQIVKPAESKKTQVNDLEGLRVSLSTQTEIHESTDSHGRAVLKGIHLIPGYPVFVDVSSKYNNENSYQYRYQLGKRNLKGDFVLLQYPERIVRYWTSQSDQKINGQSGMVIGYINRKKIKGFKEDYFANIALFSKDNPIKPSVYSILWNQKISDSDPLEGDLPRFISMNIPEGLAKVSIVNEDQKLLNASLLPVSPRVINVISE